GLRQYLAGNDAAAAESFGEYLASHAAGQDAMNRALAHTVLGFAAFSRHQPGGGDGQGALAAEHLRKAATLLPNSAAANAWAVSFFARAPGAGADEARGLEKALVDAVRVENDPEAVANLERLYRLPNAGDFFGG